MGLLCSSCWLIFGIYGKDINIVIPNGLGVIFSIIQVITWVIFYNKNNAGPKLEQFMNEDDEKLNNIITK